MSASPTTHAGPPDIGVKFTADGSVLPFAGNTIICHLAQQGEGYDIFDAFLDIYRDLPARSFARKVAVLPPSSYHMTIFGGANDPLRGPGGWPADLGSDASIEACNAWCKDRLSGFDPGLDLPIRMVIDDSIAGRDMKNILIHLRAAEAAQEAALRRLRDGLSSLLGIRTGDHEDYRFHLSIGYRTAWFDEAEADAFDRALREWRENLKAKAPEITFGAPEFCTFGDMFAFRRIRFLQNET